MNTDRIAYGQASVILGFISTYHQAYVLSEGANTQAHQMVCASVQPGLYEHWKSSDPAPKFYAVYGAGTEQDTHIPRVAYAALYTPHQGILTFRHLLDTKRGFLAPIKRDAYEGPRFVQICTLTRIEIATLLDAVDGFCLVTRNSSSFQNRARLLTHIQKLLGNKDISFV